MHTEEPISKIIGEIYEGSVDPGKWHSALRQFVDLSGGRAAFLAIVNEDTQTLAASTVVGPETSRLDDAMNLYQNELVEFDPGFRSHRPEGGRFRFHDTTALLTPYPELWRDFIRHDFGSGDYHSYIGPTGANLSVSLALHTHPEQTVINARQERLHALVYDHLNRAARLAYRQPRLQFAREAILLVDAGGRVVDASPAAERILSLHDGLDVGGGKLYAFDGGENKTLQLSIDNACHPGRGDNPHSWIAVHRAAPKHPWLLHLEPFPLLSLGQEGGAYYCSITIGGEPNDSEIDPDILRTMFDLTPREAQIAALLATSSDDLPDIARQLNIGYETARTHSRAAMAKLGAANRIDLVRTLSAYRQS